MPLAPEEGKVHWRAPLVIVCSFVIATLLASAHHILYHFLDGTKVNDRIIIQQTILASGTALAFLFRACLLLGLGVTYCQVFWWSIRRSPLELSSLDSLGGLLHSVFELRNFYALLACPALAALALLMWLLPLTAIIPPATLAVGTSSTLSTDIRPDRQNGASYSNRISTFLRVAVQQDLYSLIPPDEQRGADPLPRSIAKAKFDLQRISTDSSLSRLESRGTFRQDDMAKDGSVVVAYSSV